MPQAKRAFGSRRSASILLGRLEELDELDKTLAKCLVASLLVLAGLSLQISVERRDDDAVDLVCLKASNSSLVRIFGQQCRLALRSGDSVRVRDVYNQRTRSSKYSMITVDSPSAFGGSNSFSRRAGTRPRGETSKSSFVLWYGSISVYFGVRSGAVHSVLDSSGPSAPVVSMLDVRMGS